MCLILWIWAFAIRPASHNRLLEKPHWCSCNNNVSLLSQFGGDDMLSIRAIVRGRRGGVAPWALGENPTSLP